MLSIELMGGLGNQLFQIFTIISYSLDNNIEYKIIEFKKDKVSPLDNKSLRNTYWTNLFNNIYSNTIQKLSGNIYIYNEPPFKYTPLPIIKDKTNNYMFVGYFQSYKYFNHNLDQILQQINMEDKLNILNNKTNYDFNNIVSLHFRIGDYIMNQEFHPILIINYYINCINQLIIDTKRDDWTVLYFYEESNKNIIDNHILTLQSKFNKLKFIGIDHKLEDWEQMLTMSLCQHNIIANSTFSWWGAYLNKNNNKVYYPDIWFGKGANIDVSNMILDTWVEINN